MIVSPTLVEFEREHTLLTVLIGQSKSPYLCAAQSLSWCHRLTRKRFVLSHQGANEHDLPEFTNHQRERGHFLPKFVFQEFHDYLKCGRLEHGFVRVKCTGCRNELLMAFSCKNRGFCPSCGGRRMIDKERSAGIITANVASGEEGVDESTEDEKPENRLREVRKKGFGEDEDYLRYYILASEIAICSQGA